MPRYHLEINDGDIKKLNERELTLLIKVTSQEGDNCKVSLKIEKEKDGFKWVPQDFSGNCSNVQKDFEKIMNAPPTVNRLKQIVRRT